MHKLLMFNDDVLLCQALTHRSYVNEHPDALGHNERLEFLGDSLLNFISGQYLYRTLPDLAEDELTRRRSALVDEPQLAQFAIEVGLDLRMRLGKGVIRQGGYQNPNLLSSTFEAVVGAYYLDKGCDIEAVRVVVEEIFQSVPHQRVVDRATKDAKNLFQEVMQAQGAAQPKYKTEQIGGTDHAPEFSARVYVGEKLYGEGSGRSKKEAEKEAAANALKRLNGQGRG
ncbi:ribonuclease III [Leptolyngbya ohadii]|uniref:ribonuclease III n=1 Tax=Leptolyngbya ohadii TaxID=1962290 RepID=UPI000B599AAF|nr:ribonuclease III [Leptolyngbya ohadii]